MEVDKKVEKVVEVEGKRKGRNGRREVEGEKKGRNGRRKADMEVE